MSEGTVAQASDTITSAPATVASPPVEAPAVSAPVPDTSASSVTALPAAPAVGTASDTPPVVAPVTPQVAPTADAAPKPADVAPIVTPEPVVEPPAEEVKAPEPVSATYELKVPTGIEVKPEMMADFRNILGEINAPQDGGQKLLDLHVCKMREYDALKTQQQNDVWAKTQKEWTAKVDKVFGKDRDTVVSDANWAINNFVKSKAERAELFQVLGFTGAGNHHLLIKAWANVAKAVRERQGMPTGISVAPKASPAERRYNKTK